MNRLYAFLYPILWFFFGLVHPWKAVGHTVLPEGGALLCGNHTSLSDPVYVVLAVGHRPQCRVMAKAELLRVPILGPILKRAGVIGVDRGKADVGAIKTSMKALKNGEKLLMFPEGTRVDEEREGDAHTGAAMLAARTGVPIVPVYIPRKKKWFRRTKIVFGEPFQPAYEGKRATPEDYRAISADLMACIYALEEQGL